ncbi:ferritin-like domain-containing protein [Halorussus pelagicus]|uniref:ferritin-like domain-containing protein n=1 Tax=Halorussus pelagicus TaxID=2505977 RepID=UPI000FFB1BBE|nr:ferritin-like domain-containing protein [Halorussus pelagicus]
MTVNDRVSTDNQLARLLQIGVVLEEVVEVRAARHYETLSPDERDDAVEELLEAAREESADHRRRLEDLIDQLDARAVPLEEIQTLVEGRYAQTGPESFDGVLYDQLHGEETAYKFYDDLIEAIEASDTDYALDREELLATLKTIREEEAEGVEEVTEIMEARE